MRQNRRIRNNAGALITGALNWRSIVQITHDGAMRQNGPQRRGRGRPSGRRGFNNSPNRSYDSNGPEVKIRGTASTVYEKYQALARDATTSGDRVAAENYFQHAEHYYRVMQATKPPQPAAGEAQQQGNQRGEQRGDQQNDQRGDQHGEQRNDQRGDQRDGQRDGRNRNQQNRNCQDNGQDNDPATAEASGNDASVGEETADEAVAEVIHTGASAIAAAEVEAAEAAGRAAASGDEDDVRDTPMNPVELAAMSGSGSTAREPNGSENAEETAETPAPAPKRQPRRRPAPEPAPVVAEGDDTPAPVAEEVEPS